ncbi:cytochrome c maturation protein CcmE [Kangiella sp. HZ709]|uniref:cytochrome c maturation protein CcmE n=1 Tax=Kangiella sp. HZ709 TaxID=2666328 RepID=UPI0012B0B5EB|nr:cytochrome c maturation protein CcmE [Kangiella sp. HZ709]MRX26565.1 cytochrome c maturation protein CcmE [Kangiella sp. HZ709]
MKAHRKKKLITILSSLVLLSTAVGLLLYAIGDYADAFYEPSRVVNGDAPLNKTIRVGGLVTTGSVKRAKDSLYVEFDITDNQEVITITFDKSLPDLFREGQGIMAEGKLVDSKTLKATKVLAKHDEKYMPPEIAETLKKSHKDGVKKMEQQGEKQKGSY